MSVLSSLIFGKCQSEYPPSVRSSQYETAAFHCIEFGAFPDQIKPVSASVQGVALVGLHSGRLVSGFVPVSPSSESSAESPSSGVESPSSGAESPLSGAVSPPSALSENPNAIAPAESFPEQRGSISNDSLRLSYTTKGGKITESLIIKEKYAEKAVDLSIGLAGDGSFPELSTVFSREPDYEVESSAHNSVTFRYATETVAERKQISLHR